MSSEDENEPGGVAIAFARTPGLLKGNAIIDFDTAKGQKLYKEATKPLDNLHDLSASNLRDFLELLEHRAEVYDWTTICEIEDPDNEDEFISILRDYGRISLRQVRDEASVYEGTENRAAQDSQMMADCLTRSLTIQARQTVTLYKKEYTVNGVKSGPALLRVIVRESHIDTKATTRLLRKQLQDLDNYIVSIDSDVIKFNEHVKGLLQELAARGETTYDLLSYLFQAYAQVSDQVFVKYIDKYRDRYDEGEYIDDNKLMELAKNKYKLMKEEGTWNAPSKEAKEIITLRAQVDKLKISKANKTKESEIKEDKNQGEELKRKKYKPRKSRKPSWMLIPPKPNESHKKYLKGDEKPFYWCPKHESWGRHTPQSCEGKGYIPGKNKRKNVQGRPEETKPEEEPSPKKVKIAKALMAVMMEED